MAEQVPSIGRIVHYVAYGTPKGEYLPEHRAAIITEVHDERVVGLAVLNPTGLFFHRNITYNAAGASGTWHWPEYVPAKGEATF